MLPKQTVAAMLNEIFAGLGVAAPARLVIEEPRDLAHGDLSTNAALLLGRSLGMKPYDLAGRMAQMLLEACPDLEKAEAAMPGFCNLTFKPDFWRRTITEIETKGDAYGHCDLGAGQRALVEYVSANPTGPLHVGHGRGAALGDSVARLLRAAGYETGTEYYLNDAGRQMNTLGLSIWLRVQELAGRKIDFPEDCYQGQYIIDLASQLMRDKPGLADMEEAAGCDICREFGMREILAGIKTDLANFRCEHQRYFSEKSLVENNAVEQAFQVLRDSGKLYESEGALWFRSSQSGDDQDRVLRKSDGSLTYFATDIAYHHNKYARGYNRLVDVWGADHHGYIPRMRAAIQCMGDDEKTFDVLLVQMVNLLRDGQKISMSTRAGKFVPLDQVIDEVGVDAARFMFLSRSSDSPLDFDLELAKKRSMDNPVYYVQYAHARICALMRRAESRGLLIHPQIDQELLPLLDTPEDLGLLRKLAAFTDVVANAAKNLAPQYVTVYLMELATKIHSYYAAHTILVDDDNLALARLGLLRAAAQVLRNGLFLLGVEAPESM